MPIAKRPSCRHAKLLPRLLDRLPELQGRPIRLEQADGLCERRGSVHAGAFLRQRRIAFDCTADEFPRIFVHEVAHFIWLRLGNPKRLDYEALVLAEWRSKASGELGWSAEWRKQSLAPSDVRLRTRRWREYCCESFCDTAAWLYSGVGHHAEFTLGKRLRGARAGWFEATLARGPLSI